jgi:hypothetical protein
MKENKVDWLMYQSITLPTGYQRSPSLSRGNVEVLGILLGTFCDTEAT